MPVHLFEDINCMHYQRLSGDTKGQVFLAPTEIITVYVYSTFGVARFYWFSLMKGTSKEQEVYYKGSKGNRREKETSYTRRDRM